MKPTLNMEEGKPAVIMTGIPQASQVETKKGTKLKRGLIIGVVTMVIVAAVVIVSVYLGVKLTRDSYDEAWQTYTTNDGKSVEEKVTKKEDSLDIHVPNEMDVVYDYKHGLVIQRFFDNEGKKSPCYASYMNATVDPTPANVNMENSENNLPEEDKTETMSWKFTENRVPSYMLSEDVRNMCVDTSVFWMEKGTSDVEKRGVCGRIYYRWYCYRVRYCKYCVIYYYCCNSYCRPSKAIRKWYC